jgi:hypothetical protein
MQANLKRAARVLAIGTTLAMAPVAYSPDRGLHENTATCQGGTCCPEPYSICGLNGVNFQGYYYKSEGRCTQVKPSTPG